MTDVLGTIRDLRSRASFFANKRRKDVELYQVLAECLAICETVERERSLPELIEQFLAQRSEGVSGRRYLESNPDVYLVVGRLVFEQESNRAACWRYTATLREAAQLQIASSGFVEWLRTNGGINALFKARKVAARTAQTKTLHLNNSVEVPKTGVFTLTLQRDHRGFFDVISRELPTDR